MVVFNRGEGAVDLDMARFAERTAGFADRRRGVAAGRHLGQLWTTTDGGRHWEPVTSPVTGLAESVETY